MSDNSTVPIIEIVTGSGSTDLSEEFYGAFLNLEIEDNAESASTFKIKLAYGRDEAGDWIFPDHEKLDVFEKVSISAKFQDGTKQNLIEGYITNVDAHLDNDDSASSIEISGLDSTILLDLEETEKTYQDKSDSEIAQEVFQKYGFKPNVDATDKPQEGFTRVQRGTDIQFLKDLAMKNGFECFVDTVSSGGSIGGYFQKPSIDESSQNILYFRFGPKTNLIQLDISIDGIRPMSSELKQKNTSTIETVSSLVEKSTLKPLGKKNLKKLFEAKMSGKSAPKILLSRQGTDVEKEMKSIVNSVVDEGSWFVVAKGEVDSSMLGSILEAKKLVTIYGVGDTFSGDYYVVKVLHKFSDDSYVQEFEANRNALGIK